MVGGCFLTSGDVQDISPLLNYHDNTVTRASLFASLITLCGCYDLTSTVSPSLYRNCIIRQFSHFYSGSLSYLFLWVALPLLCTTALLGKKSGLLLAQRESGFSILPPLRSVIRRQLDRESEEVVCFSASSAAKTLHELGLPASAVGAVLLPQHQGAYVFHLSQ